MPAPLAKNKPAGYRLMLDYIDHENTGWELTKNIGCVAHYRSNSVYTEAAKTHDIFRSQAKKTAKDVAALMPNELTRILMFRQREKEFFEKEEKRRSEEEGKQRSG